jgi:RNA recognition motif-containing protein
LRRVAEFDSIEGAQQAIKLLNGTMMGGRKIFVREDREAKVRVERVRCLSIQLSPNLCFRVVQGFSSGRQQRGYHYAGPIVGVQQYYNPKHQQHHFAQQQHQQQQHALFDQSPQLQQRSLGAAGGFATTSAVGQSQVGAGLQSGTMGIRFLPSGGGAVAMPHWIQSPSTTQQTQSQQQQQQQEAVSLQQQRQQQQQQFGYGFTQQQLQAMQMQVCPLAPASVS